MKITITRVEGPTDRKSHVVDTFADANNLLRQWSWTAPEKGGYDKCDFHIADDTDPKVTVDYYGRYDLKHWRCEPPDLKQHVLDHLMFISGRRCPSRLTQDQYTDLLTKTYRFTQEEMDAAFECHEYLKGKL